MPPWRSPRVCPNSCASVRHCAQGVPNKPLGVLNGTLAAVPKVTIRSFPGSELSSGSGLMKTSESPVEPRVSGVDLLIDDLMLAGACAAGNLDYVALPDDSVVVFGKRRKRGQGAQRGGPRGSNFPAIRAAGILTGFVVIREDGIVEDQFPGILVLGSEVVVLHVLERPRTDSRYGQRIRLAEINEVREPGAAVAGEADLAAAVEGPGAHVGGEGTAGLVLARPAVDMQGDPLGNRRWSGAVDAHTVVIARKRGRVIEHTLKRRDGSLSGRGTDHAGRRLEAVRGPGLVRDPIDLQEEIARIDLGPHGSQVDIHYAVLIHVDPGGLPVIEQSILIGIQVVGPCDELIAVGGRGPERHAMVAAPHGADSAGGLVFRGIGQIVEGADCRHHVAADAVVNLHDG